MNFPSFMPHRLQYCETAASDEDLFSILVKKPNDLVLFFEVAAGDETWSEGHADLLKRIISWLTTQVFLDRLSIGLCKRTATAIQLHHPVLFPMMPENIHVVLKDGTADVNSLLLASASDFFKTILATECRDKETTCLNLENIPYRLFAPVCAYIASGTVPDLWKKDQQEVEEQLRQALSWRVQALAEICQTTLKKYIDKDNAIDLLIRAQREMWPIFKKECVDFINEKMSGFRLGSPSDEGLAFQFYDFSDKTMGVFHLLKPWITDLICSGELIENVLFTHVVRDCPKLILLDISGSLSFSQYLSSIPKDLQGISLAECLWLNQATLKKIAEICPQIKSMTLSGNYQLKFSAWGELAKFTQLTSLNLSSCHQISDDDLMIILKACPRLTDFIIDRCGKIGEIGFFAIAKSLTNVTSLSLVRCSLTDSALLEIAVRCRALTTLNVTGCSLLTEKGFLELSKHAYALKKLILTDCRVTESTLEEIHHRRPYLDLQIER